MNKLEFKQIALALDSEGNEAVIALDHRGQVWSYTAGIKPNQYRNGWTAGWSLYSMEESQPIPRLGEQK